MSEVVPSSHNEDEKIARALSHLVHDTILNICQSHPQWLQPAFSHYNWQNEKFRARSEAGFAKKLRGTGDRDRLIVQLTQILHKIFQPDFFVSNEYLILIKNIRSYTHPILAIEQEQAENRDRIDNGKGISILLLDAENLQLTQAAEEFLESIAVYPLQIKLAFANWRNLGKKDLEFSQRGYELIHVPPKKNNADLKMTAVGSSLFLHYSNIGEVFVGSADRDLNHLCQSLQRQGLDVYQVYRSGDILSVMHLKTGRIHTHNLTIIPTLEETIDILEAIIKTEQANNQLDWIKLEKVADIFSKTHKISLNQVAQKHLNGKTSKAIFLEYPDRFVCHTPSNANKIHVTVFNNNSDRDDLAINPINSKSEFQQVLVEIVERLSQNSPEARVPIDSLAKEFIKQYEKPVTQVIKDLNLGNKFLKFLQENDRLQWTKQNNIDMVSIRDRADESSSKN